MFMLHTGCVAIYYEGAFVFVAMFSLSKCMSVFFLNDDGE